MSGFHKRECTCVHTAKKHKLTGRCAKGCGCQAGARKADRKSR